MEYILRVLVQTVEMVTEALTEILEWKSTPVGGHTNKTHILNAIIVDKCAIMITNIQNNYLTNQ